MKLLPKYAQNIIVATICDNVFSWYVTEKDVWFLDLHLLKDAYKNKGYDINIAETSSIRYGFPVLDEQTFAAFKTKIDEYRCQTSQLCELLTVAVDDCPESRPYELYPSLLVDFDRKVLHNCYYEPEAFENFVPIGWKGADRDFLDDIPMSERFWVAADGKNLFQNTNVEPF